jgi:hypothetical protein
MFWRSSTFLVSLFLFAAFALCTGFLRNALALIVLNGVMLDVPGYAFECDSVM